MVVFVVTGGIPYPLSPSLPVGQEPGGGVRDFQARKFAVGLTGTFVKQA